MIWSIAYVSGALVACWVAMWWSPPMRLRYAPGAWARVALITIGWPVVLVSLLAAFLVALPFLWRRRREKKRTAASREARPY